MHRLRYRPRPAVKPHYIYIYLYASFAVKPHAVYTAKALYGLPRFCGIYNRIYNHLLPHADARTAINVNRMNHQMCVACVSAHFYIKQQQQRQQQHQQASNQTNLPANKPHPTNLISPTNLIPANLMSQIPQTCNEIS